MFIKLNSAATVGLDCMPVDVEVDINRGQSKFIIVGLPDVAIQEAKSRIYSAIKNSDFEYPFNFRILVNLAPADLHKEGTAYDLPMAVGILSLHGKYHFNLDDALMVGELALDGSVRHVNGILPLTSFAKQRGLKRVFVPISNANEAGLVDGIKIYPIKNLKQLLEHLIGTKPIKIYKKPKGWSDFSAPKYDCDMAFVKGQEFVKRALEIAASGSHNILLSGPPGSGKTMLARTMPSILPRLTLPEALEITKIYSIIGLLEDGYIKYRPFRSPHHTASGVALVGGGKYPRPGEISMAHRGILFLDEFPQFSRSVLENLRQPLEDGVITVSRAEGSITFPARFILVASQNPCPCGFNSDPQRQCTCTPIQIANYQKKISGPLLDRIDLHVEVPRVKFEKLSSNEEAESSIKVRQRVENAREIQKQRFKSTSIYANSEMAGNNLKLYCKLDEPSVDLLKTAVVKMSLSARAYSRVLKVARTIADLSGAENIQIEHVAEALQYRTKSD